MIPYMLAWRMLFILDLSLALRIALNFYLFAKFYEYNMPNQGYSRKYNGTFIYRTFRIGQWGSTSANSAYLA